MASRRTRKWRPAGGAAAATLERSVEVALGRGGGAAAADPGRVRRSPADAGQVAEVRQVCLPFGSCPSPGSVSAAEARGPLSADGAPVSFRPRRDNAWSRRRRVIAPVILRQRFQAALLRSVFEVRTLQDSVHKEVLSPRAWKGNGPQDYFFHLNPVEIFFL